MIVGHILQAKGNEVWSVESKTPVLDALRLMADKKVGALLVLDEEELVGIFSERDYARKVVLMGRSATNTPVSELMTTKVFFVQPNNSIEECMALMTERRIRHLPVYEDERLVGVISIGDVVKAIISDKEQLIEQLVNYIEGRQSTVTY